ncbi:MAG: hypothetical protein FWD18_02360 [Micrococcales bacterium]|nr:hypothetical protein [Micrococcales bacterium]
MRARKNLIITGGIFSIVWGLFHVAMFTPVGFVRDPESLGLEGLTGENMENAVGLIDLITLFNNGMVIYMVGIGIITIIAAKTMAGTRIIQALLVMQVIFWIARMVVPMIQESTGPDALSAVFLAMVVLYSLPLVVGRRASREQAQTLTPV